MAVTAAASVTMVMIVAVTSAVVLMPTVASVTVLMPAVASVTVVMPTSTSAAASHLLDERLYFLLSGLAVLDDSTREVQHLPSQRVVGVDGYTVFLDFLYLRHEALVVSAHQRDDSALEDIVMVEMPIDCEDLTSQFVYTLGIINAESLCRLEGEVEGCAFLVLDHLLLETVECDAEAGNQLKRSLFARLLLKVLLPVSDSI